MILQAATKHSFRPSACDGYPLNVYDSSDGGKFNSLDNALLQAERMIQAGVGIIDIDW